MDMLEIMKKEEAYCSDHRDMPGELQKKAKMLCWRYNQTSPEEGDVRAEILRELLGTCHPAQRAAGIGTSAPVTIGRDVWIGANSTVCGGVSIGDGTIIGAGSVVTKDIPSGVIAAGNPCRVLRRVTEEDRCRITGEERG